MANLEFQEFFDNERPTFFKEKIQSALYHYGDKRVRKELEHLHGFKPHIVGNYRYKEFTLRNDTKNRWHTGKDIHFVMNGELFAPSVPAKVDFVRLRKKGNTLVVLFNGRCLGTRELFRFVTMDGFNSLSAFMDYHFAIGQNELYKALISWTELKF